MGSKSKKYYYVDCGDDDVDKAPRFNTLDALVSNYSVYVKLLNNDDVEIFSAPSKPKTREHKKTEDGRDDEIRASKMGRNRRKRGY